jgi:hypothetical protein
MSYWSKSKMEWWECSGIHQLCCWWHTSRRRISEFGSTGVWTQGLALPGLLGRHSTTRATPSALHISQYAKIQWNVHFKWGTVLWELPHVKLYALTVLGQARQKTAYCRTRIADSFSKGFLRALGLEPTKWGGKAKAHKPNSPFLKGKEKQRFCILKTIISVLNQDGFLSSIWQGDLVDLSSLFTLLSPWISDTRVPPMLFHTAATLCWEQVRVLLMQLTI